LTVPTNLGQNQTVDHNTRLFAEQLTPRFKRVHSGWEDKWWPMPCGERAAPAGFRCSVTQAAAA